MREVIFKENELIKAAVSDRPELCGALI